MYTQAFSPLIAGLQLSASCATPVDAKSVPQ